MQGTLINIFVQRGHGKNTLEMGQFGKKPVYFPCDCLWIKLLTNNPWCGSDQLSKILSIRNPYGKKIASKTCHDIPLFKFLGFNKFLGLRKQSIFVVASDKKQNN